jgi:16S rRNA (cytosine1402-N4)-methyltransferase
VEQLPTWQHTTVLLSEAVDALISASANNAADGHYIDATFGRGGHSRLILSRLSPAGRLTAFDKDTEALAEAATITDARFAIRHESFDAISSLPPASAQGILMDLGISSPQIDNPERGFSFRGDGPLDMRMDTTRGQSVAEWLSGASAAQIEQVVRDYGEERFARGIAKAITEHIASRGAITRTGQLADLIAGAVKTREHGQHPATRSFQAFRIFINDELGDLQRALEASLKVLAPGGRLVVISFHSLEDRIVKQFIAKHSRELVDRRDPAWFLQQNRPSARMESAQSATQLIAIERIKPSEAEVAANPRARSAIMRVAQKTGAPA